MKQRITYIGPIATNRKDANGNKFSDEALNDLIYKNPIVPVTVNFSGNPIGRTVEFKKRSDGVILCEVELDYPDLERLDLFLVPGGRVNLTDLEKDTDGTTIIKKMEIYEVSITTMPADKTLTTINKKENPQ